MDLVDRNIRQRMLPFVWEPSDDINSKEASELKDSLKTVWTFRNKEKYVGSSNNPKLGITPEDHNYFKQDIANKQLFALMGDNTVLGGDLTFDNLLDFIPAIQIREYTQDTRLDLILSFVDYLVKGFKDGKATADNLTETGSLAALTELLAYDLKNISNNKHWKGIIELFEKVLGSSEPYFYTEKNSLRKCVLDFVHAMYYRILSTTTTNIYTLPYSSSHVIKGNGFTGFEDGFDVGSKLDDSSSALVKFIAPNITLTTTPMWRGVRGGESVSIDITFNLFNDRLDKAITNFIFVNTILPQNLPTQYAIFSQPPSLYDIKIEGGNRLFMCAGNFNCTYKGVMRQPSNAFFDGLIKHVNTVIFKSKKEAEKKPDENVQKSKSKVEEAEKKLKEAEEKEKQAREKYKQAQMDYEAILPDAEGDVEGGPFKTELVEAEKAMSDASKEVQNAFNNTYNAYGEFQKAQNELNNANEEKSKAKQSTSVTIKTFVDNLKNNNCIKIPDVYEITMTFKSLLPNNFNNFLSQYAMNSKMTDSSMVINRPGIMDSDNKFNENMTNIISEWVTERSKDANELANINVDIAKAKKDYEEKQKIADYTDANKLYDIMVKSPSYENTTTFNAAATDDTLADDAKKAYESEKNKKIELLNKGNNPTE